MAGFTGIPIPTFGAIDTSGIDALKRRLAEADRYAADPRSTPGVQQAIVTTGQQAARAAQGEIGGALSRASARGQAGFGGALADTAADIRARQSETLTTTTADLLQQAYQQARAEGLSVSEAIVQAQAQVEQLRFQRQGLISGIQGQNAGLEFDYTQLAQQKALEDARLREQSRQFEKGFGLDERKLAAQISQFAQSFGLQQKELDSRIKQWAQQFGLDERKLAEQVKQFNTELAARGSEFDRTLGFQKQQLTASQEQFLKNYDLQVQKLAMEGKQLDIAAADAEVDRILRLLGAGTVDPYTANLMLRSILKKYGTTLPAAAEGAKKGGF